MKNDDAPCELEEFFCLPANDVTLPILAVETHAVVTLKLFDLKEVVAAVSVFLRKTFKNIKVEISSLCEGAVSIFGNKGQFQKVLVDVISGMSNRFKHGAEMFNVIIHELKRPTDVNFLPCDGALSGKGDASSSEEIRAKYIAVSIKKKDESSVVRPSNINRGGKGEVSYFDGGMIVKINPFISVIYLLKLETN